jgi:hypothetical protein
MQPCMSSNPPSSTDAVDGPVSAVVAHALLRVELLMVGGRESPDRLEAFAHILTLGVMTLFNYFAMKYLAFARTAP